MTQLIQPSLSGGELSPSLYARVDVARYQQSVRTGKNFLVRPNGGMLNRSGFGYVARAREDDTAKRLLPFQVSSQVAYIIELGAGYMRFYANGAVVLDEEVAITVAGDEITTVGSEFELDDWLMIGGEEFVVVLVVGNTYTLQTPGGDPGAPVGAVAQRIAQVDTPWDDEEIWALNYTQSADTMLLAHPDHPPRQLKRLTPTTFELIEFETRDGPFGDINHNEAITIRASATTGNVDLEASTSLFNEDHVGMLLYLEDREFANIKPWEQGERGLAIGDQRSSEGKAYTVVGLASNAGDEWVETGSIRPTHDDGRAWDGPGTQKEYAAASDKWSVGVLWEYLHSGYGIVKITEYTSPTEVSGEIIRRLPDSVVGGSVATNTWNLAGDGATLQFNVAGATSTNQKDYRVYIDNVPLQPNPNHRIPRNPGQIPF